MHGKRLIIFDYVIVLIGDKKNYTIPEKIISIDKTNDVEELVDWYSSADLFVNPTLGDNFPTVNLEALSCGTPVITSKTGGAPEPIDSSCGVVVTNKTAQGFKEAIESFCGKKMDNAFHNSFVAKFDKKTSFQKYIELYETIRN